MAAPTTEERLVIKEFRKMNMEVAEYSDLQCLVWLRARDHNLSKATEMLKKHLRWYEETEIHNLLDWQPPVHFLEDYPVKILGTDAGGRPVVSVPFGKYDIRKAINNGEYNVGMKYIIQALEKVVKEMKESSKRVGKEITQFVLLADSASFSFRQLASIGTVKFWIKVMSTFEANYPETLYSCYVINASNVFHALFSIIKPILSAHTIGKVCIFTTSDTWQPILLENIPPEILPVEYCGCAESTQANLHPIPEKSFSQRLNSSEYKSIEVEAGKSFEISYSVTKPGTLIAWAFVSEHYDIGFSITLNRNEEILPYGRCNAHLAEEVGTLICENAGEHFLIFDNTYSKMRGKRIHYSIEIVLPEDGNL